MLRDIMNRDLITATVDTTIPDIARLMADHNVGTVLILDQGKPFGMLTDRDIVIRCIANHTHASLEDCSLTTIISDPLRTINESAGVYECVERMRADNIRRMVVINDVGDAVGIISAADLLALFSRELADLASIHPGSRMSEERRKAA